MAELRTLPGWIQHWAKTTPNTEAIYDRVAPGQWKGVTWKAYWDRVRAIGKGLIDLGVKKGDVVAIIANNRTDWVCCQFGAAAVGAILAPIYVTNTVEQVAYIVKHSGAKVAIADGSELLQKYLDGEAQGLMECDHYITMDAVDAGNDKVISLDTLMSRGQDDDAAFDGVFEGLEPDDVTMLIFTSGTTGLPKGAMYTHRSIDTTGGGCSQVYPAVLTPAARQISYLPLCHAAEQGFTNFVGLRAGGKAYFLDDIKQIKDALGEVRPTVFLGVPRVWEKFEAALRGRLAEATGIKAKLASWSLKTELSSFYAGLDKPQEHWPLTRKIANKLVVNKIKTALGLENVVLAATGAAPISLSTLEFFASLGIPLHEGFGMTETTAFATISPHKKPKFGAIGKAFPGVEVKIADDGEIMLRGDNMVKGYYKLPEKSAELWSDDGWMHTGDLGELDNDGFLKITGRKKDLLITAGGKNVAPAEIEGLLQALPGVGQSVVVGDRQPYLCALLVLDPEALPELAKAVGVSGDSVEVLAKDPAVLKYFREKIDGANINGKLARYQTIKKFEVLPQPFSVEGGELTPTMKVKRNIVNDKYADVIGAMYAEKKSSAA